MTGTLDMAYPFTGHWLVQNSPGNRVPSHGTARFASTYAIDFVPVDDNGHTAPVSPRTFVRPEPPETFPGFGRTVLSPVDGTVVAVHGGERDHPAYRGLPSVRYALSQRRRAAVAECGNTGNSTEPHLHLQAVQGPDVARGIPVAVTFHGVLPRNGDIV